ncbi:helix-turn-helix transcriptional regulator [Yoonia sediminilitoris]|uniref:WYL domain-containing protein n=1 Tax=Yoonia sediminilitoris TaxID=1286148 RepID=A0A2T6KQ10_9RHOB|nr:YafY family protein [Yoonia sediminilitoris]PUB18642.1 WYL domain-containing protein [Yoonia sediminilitoris]RCW98810.1 WYL domain-containing protein [Yoonia sediminilitoris]
MAKSDRILRLIQLLRSLPKPVTAAVLAEKLEVSKRTVYRDIDALRIVGARVDGEAGVGYALIEDIALPPQTLTRLETEALSIGLSEVQFRGDAKLADAARDAFSKITATLKESQQRDVLHAVSQVYRFTKHDASEVEMTTIREACWSEHAMLLTYRDRAGSETTRRIYPLAVLYFERAVMLLGFCHLRNDYRKFHVTQIISATPLKESFRPRRVQLLNDYVTDLRKRVEEWNGNLSDF